ncbi:MAG: hypothetical protein LBN97_03835 [Oscillospiraceae bacterium]|jgi:hypothetical protein|nr:hypothetical protein [Oscillospiraceae bacterium]
MKFEESGEQKNRPALVLPDSKNLLRIVKMTGTPCRDIFEHRLVYWKYAGLVKPTTIRTSKIIDAVSTDMLHKIGDLHPDDIEEFAKKLNALYA